MLQGESLSGANIRVVIDFDDQAAVYGTPKTSGKKGKILAYNQETVIPNAALIASAAITGSRTKTAKVPGNIDVTGNLVIEMTYDLLPYFLYLAWGSKSATGAATPWTHTVSPGSDIPTFMLERKLPYAAADRFYRYSGCRINTWSFEFKSSGFVIGTFGVSGGNFLDSATQHDASAVDFRTGTKIHGQHLKTSTIKLDNVATLELLDLTISGSSNLIPDDYPMGANGYRGGNGPGGFGDVMVKGNLRCLTNATVALLDGEPHTLEFQHEKTVNVLSALWTMYAVQFNRTHPAASGPGAVRLAFEGEAVQDGNGDVIDCVAICGLDPADIA
jgi:hypothetical protein